ncbi:MAG TPA: hypothetical protein DEP48_06155 [Persephonella sp.]|uniref:Uncharacterized protein n=1 Tax=Persephonella marina (strain DSM 14350 / EX-H1) TaxID=123214 RepID=C0QP64_PERMH|nr:MULTISPECIES: hypothetical protein [Persephonella]ACO04440.1 hypothetical protein PERMA_0671 [Persephonella marina EX-H1]HCB69925.1 hypothetical protein [Persephonella sp.]
MKTLLYPCCGTEDLYYFLYRFMDDVDRFIFADLNFRRYFYIDAVNKVSKIGKVIKTERQGRFYLSREKGYLEVEPEYFYITFIYKGKGNFI